MRHNTAAYPAVSAAHQGECRHSLYAAAAGVLSQTLGLIGGACLWHRRTDTAATLQGLGHAFVVSVKQLIVWLMGAPAGLKLHEELSGLLGGTALWVLHSTHAVYSAAAALLLPEILGTTDSVLHFLLDNHCIAHARCNNRKCGLRPAPASDPWLSAVKGDA